MSKQRSGGDSVTPHNENLGREQSSPSAEAVWFAAVREYAEQSKRFTHGERNEDLLLQRIWNLAGDVTKLCDEIAVPQSVPCGGGAE